MPGPPFNGNTIIALGGGSQPNQIGITDDSSLPPAQESGAVNWAYKGSSDLFTGAFSDLAGVDVVLIHGDRREEVDGTRTETISTGVNVSVGPGSVSAGGSLLRPLAPQAPPSVAPGWEQVITSSDLDITVKGNFNQEVYGSTKYTYVDTTNITHMNTVTADYASPLQLQQPTNYNAVNWTSFQAYWLLLQFASVQIGINNVYITMVFPVPIAEWLVLPALYVTLVGGVNLTLDNTNVQATFTTKVEQSAFNAWLKGFSPWLHGALVDAGAAQLRIAPSAGAPPNAPCAAGG